MEHISTVWDCDYLLAFHMSLSIWLMLKAFFLIISFLLKKKKYVSSSCSNTNSLWDVRLQQWLTGQWGSSLRHCNVKQKGLVLAFITVLFIHSLKIKHTGYVMFSSLQISVNTFLLFLNFLRVEVAPVVLIFVLFYLGVSTVTVSYNSYNRAVYVRGALQMGIQFQNYVLME